ncbi:MAG: electron transfer flavoprotein beta subunit/FixA family protein, partial [Calditrichaeota bacterium]|nr:electron transfer flavoprotein beta subunit/FixA family protein [Calditrichota bacterium]
KISSFDIVFAGRQAIDGDTAQVGPQTAEKLGIPQITYCEEILDVKKKKIVVKRRIDGGFEILESRMPLLITVIKEAAEARPFKAKRVMAFKNAKSLSELEELVNANSLLYIEDLKDEYKSRGLFIPTFTMDDLQLETDRIGQIGSPTKVYKIDSVVLGGGEHIRVEPTNEGIGNLIDQLMNDRIFG